MPSTEERVASLEAQYGFMQQQLAKIIKGQERIKEKLGLSGTTNGKQDVNIATIDTRLQSVEKNQALFIKELIAVIAAAAIAIIKSFFFGG